MCLPGYEVKLNLKFVVGAFIFVTLESKAILKQEAQWAYTTQLNFYPLPKTFFSKFWSWKRIAEQNNFVLFGEKYISKWPHTIEI